MLRPNVSLDGKKDISLTSDRHDFIMPTKK